MDLEQYIIKKFCDFKFPLIKETENEVCQFKNKLNSSGRLNSGQTIPLLYEIRLKSISKMVDRYLEIEVETRKDKQVELNDDVLKKIENNLINFIEHEFDNLIHKMREEANLINFGKDNYEQKFKARILSDKNSLINNMKRKLEMKKFELSNDKSKIKTLEGEFDIAEICLRGHIINPNINKNPKFRKPYCDECGAKTITECLKCNNPIPGRFIYKDFEDNTIWDQPPKFCKYCGNPYPWFLKASKEILSDDVTEEYDAFLSHADEDKKSIADELYRALTNDGFKIWYDEIIKADQSIPEEINKGIIKSRNGIVVFSNYYLKKQWCMDELNTLKYKSNSSKNFKVFTILHNFSLENFKKDYPIYCHKRILSSEDGFEKILSEIEPQLGTRKLLVKDIQETKEKDKTFEKSSSIKEDSFPLITGELMKIQYWHYSKGDDNKIEVDIDGDGNKETIVFGRYAPIGTKLQVITGKDVFELNSLIKGLDEDGECGGSSVLAVKDVTNDGYPEILFAFYGDMLTAHLNIFKFNREKYLDTPRGKQLNPFELIGYISGQFEFKILSGGRIEVPYGGHGLYETYIWDGKKFVSEN
ncbi:MAG: DUF2321 domain-containing protein [Cyanobacteria bacterium]|nr:DUF2321 domain-containing protein [Cyanobacteriota bacterium]